MRKRLPAVAALLLAAALVTGIRLIPLSLPALPDAARARIRRQIAARLPAPAADAAARTRAVDAWIAAHPAEFARTLDAERARLDEAFHYRDARGRAWVHLGDFDSYAWMRAAANVLRRGSPCDAVVDGQCRDALTMAPVGLAMPHARSLHVGAIAAVHRAITRFDAEFPLAASAYLVPVLAGALGTLPAFAIGRRLGGTLAGFTAAILVGVHPVLLTRSFGSDDDVWNVVLPLGMAWALLAALQARRGAARIGGALLAGMIAALHAITWNGWGFAFLALLGGLAAALALQGARWAWQRRSARLWQAPRARAVALEIGVFALAGAGTARLLGAGETLGDAWARLMTALAPSPAAAPATPLPPSALALVGELAVPGLGAIAAQSFGRALFLAGWLGMLLLLLPRSRWRTAHFLVLIAGTVLYRVLLTTAIAGPALVAALVLPLAAAAAIAVTEGDDRDLETACAGAVIAVWLLAALLLSFHALRFGLLLAAPLGIATGVAAGRLHDWLADESRAWLGDGPWPRRLAAVAVLALALLPLRVARATATAYLPAIDGAWTGVLTRVREATPADAVLSTWWDYGYWAKYVADRRVSADGGSLRTPVPYWLARAQLADDEAEAIGLLRMLDCASDARPYPEGAQGAMARLMRHGRDERAAYDAIGVIAPQEREQADAALAALGLDAAARADVLAATHCAPPPAVLVLSTEQIDFAGWWRLGRWRPDRADDPPVVGLITRDWAECSPVDGGRRCAVDLPDGRGAQIEAVAIPEDDPRRARLVLRRDGAIVEVAPSRLLLAGGMAVDTLAPGAPDAPAVLLDGEQRALVGAPEAVASLFVRLLFLDGRGLDHFRKLDERTGARNQRVAAWQIAW